MKIAVTAQSENPNGALDPHFGRAKKFVVFDTETGQYTAHDNAQNLNAVQGAGIQAAQAVARLGAEVLLTGHVGPKAFRTLAAAGIQICLAPPGTVAAAIEAWKAGALKETTGANVEGHWV
ncbi:MAG TPA: NifB/NifX family molybdenum-iron cluster-binding protein [Kiritimatiellia bacterium]|nr:NifB/NifX family molybdenum-iron cluster-binding protein [Kiritimatiellia bacterium]HRZ10927.1 NifB/NifX family molybdenum-iron cluster-binding protein [Kiritimatiellia bacterium]HSA18800.1 NifB/NifX family molybdenum-iron cluster-binding protein [Kiritimatiellia bacterium]